MVLEYGDLLSPAPIHVDGVGTIRKPLLKDIANLTFNKFSLYEMFLKMNPETFYTKFLGDEENQKIWEEMPDEIKGKLSMFDLICIEPRLQSIYTEIFDFFIVESVSFENEVFIITDKSVEKEDVYLKSITRESFVTVCEVIQQVCRIYVKEQSLDDMKFKNAIARKLMAKMLKGKKEQEAKKKYDPSYSLPNIISAVSNYHKSITPITIWDMTIFQLMDSFERLQADVIFDIDRRRVSVWGDEKKTFDPAFWFKYSYNVE